MKGKNYRDAAKKFDRMTLYGLEDGLAMAKATSTAKFDATVEMNLNLGIDPKHAEQQIRTTVSLPHGTGKKVRIVAFVSEDKVAAVKAAGAMEAGSTELIEKVAEGWLDFDVAVASPDMMKNLAKVARSLGQAGLMPNPKAGTVTPDVEAAVSEIMKGRVEIRNDKLANLHGVIGKVSFGDKKLLENAKAFLKVVQEKKPEKMKGNYIKSLTVTTTMGPGIRLDANSILADL